MDVPLADWMIGLATDPRRRADFERDPDAALASSGLGRAARLALRQGDAGGIRAALRARRAGALTVVGTGFGHAHLTPQTVQAVSGADRVVFRALGPVLAGWVRGLNPGAESLDGLFESGRPLAACCEALAGRLLELVRQGAAVCAVFPGHPAFLDYPACDAVRRVREAGFTAVILPAISPEDLLYAEAGLDPGRAGCSTFEATDFLVHRRRFDPTSALVLLQAGAAGTLGRPGVGAEAGLAELGRVLGAHYEPHHEVLVLETAPDLATPPAVRRFPLAELSGTRLSPLAVLLVPPLPPRPPDPGMMRRLGLALGAGKEAAP